MRVALLVAGSLRGRALGTVLAARVAALKAAGCTVEVTTPAERSSRAMMIELLSGAPRADAVYVLYGAHDPLLECMRLFRDCPVVFEYAGVRPPGRGATTAMCEARARDVAMRSLARAAGRVVAATPALAREIADGAALDADATAIAPLAHPDRPLFVTSEGHEKRPLRLGCVGRPAAHRRLDVAVEALARIARSDAGVRLVVRGRCDDPEAAAARDDALGWARALGVEARVQFAGYVGAAQLYDDLDVVLTAHDSLVEREAPCPVVKAATGAEMAARVLAGDWSAPPAPAAETDWRALLAGAVRGPVSLVPLLEQVESWTIDYRDADAAVSPARWKVMRHLHKYFGLELERLFRAQVRGTARALRALDRDLDQLQ